MDENIIRPERIAGTNVDRDINMGRTTTGVNTEYDRDVDIRRNMIMGRDLDTHGAHHSHRVDRAHHLSWGSITCGLATSLTTSVLFGALFLGLGFDKSYGVFGGLTQGQISGGAMLAMAIGTFIGAYFTGYLAHVHSKLHGFMVGVTSILVPLLLGVIGAFGEANQAASNALPGDVAHHVRYSLAVAADSAWQVFMVGAIILGLATLAGYLGHKHTQNRTLLMRNRKEVDHVSTY